MIQPKKSIKGMTVLHPPFKKVVEAFFKYDCLTQSMCATVTGLSPKTCRKWLDYMVECGWLEVYRQQYRPNIISRVYVKVDHDNA